jgi:TPR repeat protein
MGEGEMKIRKLKKYGRTLLIAAALAPLAACSSMSPEAAYEDAKVQIGSQKAGFKNRRDPEALLALAAKNAKTPEQTVRYNKFYGNYALKGGKSSAAYSAFEKAALAGDPSSGRRLARGHYEGQYRPANVTQVARSVYLPLTSDKSDVTTRLLLAKLIDDRQISGSEFGNSDDWLQQAANAGGTGALRKLAERAEASGNLTRALDYYVRADKTSKADRALRQARVNYLGQEVALNLKLGHGWMEIARSLDKQGAAQLAARVYRQTSGGRDGGYLMTVAAAGGLNVLSQSQLIVAYKAAKNDAERAKITEPLRTAARQGNAEASYTLAELYMSTGGNPDEIVRLLSTAYAKGETDALSAMITLLMRAEPGDRSAETLFNNVSKAAKAGNVAAARALSTLYGIGGYKTANEEERLKWLRAAADAGDAKSQYEFGVYLYENGQAGDSKGIASQYLNKAAKNGDPFAVTYISSKKLARN